MMIDSKLDHSCIPYFLLRMNSIVKTGNKKKLQLLSKQGAGRVVGTNWKEAMEELDLGMAQRFLGKRF